MTAAALRPSDDAAHIAHLAALARERSLACRAAAEGIRENPGEDPATYVNALADSHQVCAELLEQAAKHCTPKGPDR